MMPSSDTQEKLKQYLLGHLDEQMSQDLETELLANSELFEELLILENETIDQYLGGELNPTDTAAFEEHFLTSPERHQNLQIARALNRHVAAMPAKAGRSRFLPGFIAQQSFAVRAASVLLIIAAIGVATWFLRSQRSSPRTFATLTLSISQGTRGDGPEIPRVQLPLHHDALKIVMMLPQSAAPNARYRAEVETEMGEKRTLETIAPDDHSVTVIIPAAALRHGQYSIKLFALGADGVERRISGSYYFTVE